MTRLFDRGPAVAAYVFLLCLLQVGIGSRPLLAQHDPKAEAVQEDEKDSEKSEELEEVTLENLKSPPRAIDPREVPPGSGPVTVTPGQSYHANGLHRFLFGSLLRDVWDIPFEIEVLDLAKEGGGLTPAELSGGLQTVGMRFDGADGRIYQFRSIVKRPSRALPRSVRIGPLVDIISDQMAAQFPLSAMVVAELLKDEGILVATPRPVIMPDDPRLGEYREKFAGLMGWIEERPNEEDDDSPGFAGSSKITGTEAMYDRLEEDPRNFVNAEDLLRARLIDFFVGDWDRHDGQYRWARFEEGDRIRWDPIPRDRDWALSRIDGLLPDLASEYIPQYEASWDKVPRVFNLHWNGQFLDRRLLAELPRETYERIGRELHGSFTDAALERAVGVLPAAYREAIGEELLASLRHRREELPLRTMEFYEMLAKWADIQVTDADEVATVTGLPEGRVRVEVRAPGTGNLLVFSRTYLPEETTEIRLYMEGGDDEIRIEGEDVDRIKLRLVGGKGDDHFIDATSGRNVHAYDDDGDNTFDLGPDGWLDETNYDDPDGLPNIGVIFEARDWGSTWVTTPLASFDPDIGPFLGVELTRYGFGFRRKPYDSRFSVALQLGAELGTTKGHVTWLKTLTDGGLRFGTDLTFATELNTRFFGLGNETNSDSASAFFRSQRSSVELGIRIESAQDQSLRVYVGPVIRRAGEVDTENNVFGLLTPYGADDFFSAGMVGGVALGRIENPGRPTTSALLELTGRAFPALLDVDEAFGSADAVGRLILSAEDALLHPAIHLRAGAKKVWGSMIPFDEYASLGGKKSLPGYRDRRFAGQEAASAGALGRIQLFTVRPFATFDVGVHGIATVGRVWLEGETSDEWHTGFGGGFWIYPRILSRALAVSAVQGEDGLRIYFGLGFPF